MKRAILMLLFLPALAIAQSVSPGRILGKVVDAETGEIIVGANVTVEGGTRGAASDIEGRYSITLPPGKYTILVSALSHAKARFDNIVVESAKDRRLEIAMSPEAIRMNEVVVEAKVNSSYESAMLKKQKNSISISDALSAEQIKRTPDATSGDALRRLTGISLVDNKFVFVRGVSDRYNQTTLNGTAVSSTDAEKKSFSFDMLPSSLLENTVVIKTATPDVRGDFTGGLVQLSTLDFPETQVMKVSVSSSLNSLTTGKDFHESPGGQWDWLGIDDGTRKLPEGSSLLEQARALPNTWMPRHRTAPLHGSLSISYGDHLTIERSDDQHDELGFIGAFTYRNSFQQNNKTINDYALGRYNEGTRSDFSVLWGGLLNVSYKIDGVHKFSFKNNYTQTAEDQVGEFVSQDLNTSLENRYTVINWNQRSLYSGQFSGEHNLAALGGLFIEWRLATSLSRRQVPDRKQVTYSRPIDDQSALFMVAINQRSWSELNDGATIGAVDLQIPIGSSSRLKGGALVEFKTTDYRIRYFNVTPDFYGGIPSSMTSAPLESVYDPSNYGPGKFLFEESSKASDSYDADSRLAAFYLMADLPFTLFDQKLRFVGGARLENSGQTVRVPKTLVAGGPVDETGLNNVDILPSANLTYFMGPITNFRISYSHSVNRPEFREIASTGFYDFIKYELVGGNPDLKRSLASNFDMRLEIFPDLGELFAVSYFRKDIGGAIEEKLVQAATRTRTWFNSDDAQNAGWEFEIRKSLGFVSNTLRGFSLTANYTIVKSKVDVYQAEGNSVFTKIVHSTRPMQGQSPYLLNLSLLYTAPEAGTSFNILFNKFGRRLDAVGFLASDIYEEPRDLVDLAVTQPIGWGTEVKLTVKNLNNSSRTLTRDNLLYERTDIGRTYAIQISKTL